MLPKAPGQEPLPKVPSKKEEWVEFLKLPISYQRKKEEKAVVVVLLFAGNRVLFQLRDEKPWIIYPGHWGYFGGMIEDGEIPEETVYREIEEELGSKPMNLRYLGIFRLLDHNNLLSYAFCGDLFEGVRHLYEGMDAALFSIEEVETGSLFSKKLSKSFPVIPTDYVSFLFKACLEKRRGESRRDESGKGT
ncbi:NUDIX domain-containing protein [Candidatus Woesearchaeota archaeon]|nr:NUDIX domain-containing protein [Candidatus Woesearchaeota archaeon]